VKRILLTTTCLLFLTCTASLAQEEPVLGEYHLSVELGPMCMQHGTLETDDAGIHLGADAYRHVGQNWYVGAEVGASANISLFSATNGITMYELNGKRAFDLSDVFAADLGAGVSYNSVTYNERVLFSSENDISIKEWVFGLQALANLHLKIKQVLLGVHVKYMLTQDVPGVAELEELDKGWDYSNLTIGIQVGFFHKK